MTLEYWIPKATTNVSVTVRVIDSTDGTPETAVEHNTAGMAMEYRREGAVSTAITEAALAALTTAHTDGGWEHIGNGYYRFDLPDAACATGVDGVLVHGTVTGMVVIGCYIHLTDIDIFDGVRGGMTALPNAAADAPGGLPISDAGGLDVDTQLANTNEVTAARMATLTDWINGGRLDLLLDAIPTTAMRGTDGANTTTPLTAAQVNAEVVDVLTVDTIAELSQGVPTATPTVATALMLLYMALRNKFDTQTSGTDAIELHNDAGTQIAIKLITDDGSDYSEAKMTTGV